MTIGPPMLGFEPLTNLWFKRIVQKVRQYFWWWTTVNSILGAVSELSTKLVLTSVDFERWTICTICKLNCILSAKIDTGQNIGLRMVRRLGFLSTIIKTLEFVSRNHLNCSKGILHVLKKLYDHILLSKILFTFYVQGIKPLWSLKKISELL